MSEITEHSMPPAQTSAQILLVDDDQALSELLCEYLSSEGFTMDTAFTGLDGLEKAKQQAKQKAYQLIILDIMLPNMNGIEVLKTLRQQGIQTPVLMLTAKGDDLDRILGLELGADDYVPKPCNPRELLARIKAILRRSQSSNHESSKAEQAANIDTDIHIDGPRLEASFKNQQLKLTGAEFNVLQCLHQNLGHIVSKETLCQQALGRELTRYDRSIDVHVSNLRKKLMDAGASGDLIGNQRGSGYILKPA